MYEKIAKRLDVSDEFWKQFEMHHKSTKKVMGLYEIENIDNQNICTIAINSRVFCKSNHVTQTARLQKR